MYDLESPPVSQITPLPQNYNLKAPELLNHRAFVTTNEIILKCFISCIVLCKVRRKECLFS
jgi:hypothetical protein